VNQNIFTWLNSCAGDEHMPGCNGHQWQCGRFFPAQIFWFGNHVHARRRYQLGVATRATIAEDIVVAAEIVSPRQTFSAMAARDARLQHDFVADPYPTNQFTNVAHDTGNIISKNVR
jgi:hypothetical protein